MQLNEIAKLLSINLFGKDANFRRISTDTRTLMPGDLFVALQGDTFDGHDFIEVAKQKGAIGVLTNRSVSDSLIANLVVPDTRVALGKIASHHRNQFHLPLLAITGSCGKTTTKAMLTSILSQLGSVLIPPSSYNNDVGVPLTLLQLDKLHQYAVIEMGANHVGEIAYLCEIAKPNVAVITNVAPAHLEGFGSIEGVAKTKGEIYQSLETDDIAVINIDDPFMSYWQACLKTRQCIYFGSNSKADFSIENIQFDVEGKPNFMMTSPLGKLEIQLPVLGKHNVVNALAAAACAYSVGAKEEAIIKGLNSFTPVNKRLIKYKAFKGAEIIDDTYNANPLSVSAALQTLSQMNGEKVFVFGDMAELGKYSEEFHLKIGEQARLLGVQRLYTYGNLSRFSAQAFGTNAYHFHDQIELIKTLKEILGPNMIILIKGSRSFRMEKVVQALTIV